MSYSQDHAILKRPYSKSIRYRRIQEIGKSMVSPEMAQDNRSSIEKSLGHSWRILKTWSLFQKIYLMDSTKKTFN